MQEKYRRRLLTALLAILAAAALVMGALGLTSPGTFRTAHAEGETATPPSVSTDFTLDETTGCYTATYTGSELTFFATDSYANCTVSVVDAAGNDAESSAANAGTYIATVTPDSGYAWEDETTDTPLTYTFVIEKATISAPVPVSGWTDDGDNTYEMTVAYGGSATFLEAGTGYTLTGTLSASASGTYTVIASLSDPDNYTRADGTSDAIVYTFILTVADKDPDPAEITITGDFWTVDGYTYTAAYETVFDSAESVTFIETGTGYSIYGDNEATAAGTYTVVVILSEGYAWADGFADEPDVLTFTFVIDEKKPDSAEIAINTAFTQDTGDPYAYTASYETALASTGSVTFILEGEGYEILGTNTATTAGTYTVVVILSEGYAWTGDFASADDAITFTFTVEEEIIIPVEIKLAINEVFTQDESDPYTYTAAYEDAFADGDSVTFIEAGDGYEMYGDTAATAAGSYSVVIALEDGYCWPDGFETNETTIILTFTFVIDEKKPLDEDEARTDAPAAKEGTTYTYTGEAIEFEFAGDLNTAAYTVYGGTQTEAGTYTVYVVLNEEYYWDTSDGTVSDAHAVLEFTFTIEKGEVEIPEIGTWILDEQGEVTEGNGPFVYDNGIYTAKFSDAFDGKSEYTFFAKSDYYVIYGENTVTEAGTYTVYLALSDPANLVWADGSTNVIEFTFRIVTEEGVISAPIVTKTTVEWAESITLVVLTDEQLAEYEGRVNIYGNELDGRTVDPGDTYLVTFRLADPANNYWSDLTTGDKTYSFTIVTPKTKVTVTAPDADTTTYYYTFDSDGNAVEQTYVIEESPDGLYEVFGNVQAYAGTYYVAVVLSRPDLYAWVDEDGEEMESAIIYYTFVIEKHRISPVKPSATTFTYDGRERTFMLDTGDYIATGDVKGTDAGSYAVALELVDPDNYVWADGAQITFTFVIEKATIDPGLSGIATTYTYSGSAVTFIADTNTYYAAGAVTGTDAGTYVVTLMLHDPDNYVWADGAQITYTFVIEKAKVSAPAITAQTFTYTGEEFVFLGGYTDTDLYYAEGVSSGIHAGTYEVTLVLRDAANYEWAAGAVTSFTFVIEQASNSVTIPRIGTDGYALGSAADFGTVIYRYYTDAACTKEVTSIVEAGTYYVRAEVEETEDYAGAVSAALEFEVEEGSAVSWSDVLGIGASALLLILLVIIMIVIIRRKNNG